MNKKPFPEPTRSHGGMAARKNRNLVKPACHMRRHSEGLTIALSLPGVSREKLVVSAVQDTLTVTGHRENEVSPEWECRRRSFSPDGYQITLRLPPHLDPSSIRANLELGLLTLEIRMHDSALPRRIEVN